MSGLVPTVAYMSDPIIAWNSVVSSEGPAFEVSDWFSSGVLTGRKFSIQNLSRTH